MIVEQPFIGGIICTDLLYFDRYRSVVFYHIDIFRIGPRRDLDGGNTCLGVGGKFGRNERE